MGLDWGQQSGAKLGAGSRDHIGAGDWGPDGGRGWGARLGVEDRGAGKQMWTDGGSGGPDGGQGTRWGVQSVYTLWVQCCMKQHLQVTKVEIFTPRYLMLYYSSLLYLLPASPIIFLDTKSINESQYVKNQNLY